MMNPMRVAIAVLGWAALAAPACVDATSAVNPAPSGGATGGGSTPGPSAGGGGSTPGPSAGGGGSTPGPSAGDGGSGGVAPAEPSATSVGPSTLQSPYVVPVAPGVRTISIASNGFANPSGVAAPDPMRAWDEVYPHLDGSDGGYRLAGPPDGLGVLDNGDGTFTLLMNHEVYNFAGDPAARRLGSNGAFVSEWTIRSDVDDLVVLGGRDFIHAVHLYGDTGGGVYGHMERTSLEPFWGLERFCSADLPPESAFFDGASGKGTRTRIFMTGEESDGQESYADYLSGKQDKGGFVSPPVDEIATLDRSQEVGRVFAVVADGAERGRAWELPYLGKFRWENALANAKAQEKTIVAGIDDKDPGYVFFYVGEKRASGADIERAGLTAGVLYALDLEGQYGAEGRIDAVEIPTGPARFSLYPFTADADGPVSHWSQTKLRQVASRNVAAFRGPEDGVWDPDDPSTLYFVTSSTSVPHVWKITFDDITDPTAGGTAEVILDGNAYNAASGVNEYGEPPFLKPDNMTAVTGKDGHTRLFIQEDRGGADTPSRIWLYDVEAKALLLVAQMDPMRFAPGAPYLLANLTDTAAGEGGDEESSAMLPVFDVLGEGWFLLVAQPHYFVEDLGGDPARLRQLFEGGQLLAMYIPQALGD